VKNIGAERIIFGTFLPVNDPFVSIGMLIKAQISLEEKKMIAKQNLEGIVNGIHY
jgi:predicted TIM-barrel fold metal-dependent hydrolase